ncbi:DUF6024 family protein [Xenorhabdus hominickii]|uniref:Aminotransferase class V domain-containing protein n=1 Tax=Xenorhabdus hominickii TaxID=351679 RepID=A0A2G0Q4I6_XENHO|nr:DUF6024 family protein [Xenorhabdus hominickii]AOM42451.1 hypothetical protein A9255_18970 [Xenorhabdus hominickii]PHM54133.1 hypothetical protein Xhom_03207 [Xenorhabdus hominickii]
MKCLDDSSINSKILDFNFEEHSDNNYYKQVSIIRNKIKENIRRYLCLDHEEIFLLNNSTHCLLNVIYGLNMHSTSLIVREGSYELYNNITTDSFPRSIPLLTHIDPQTGVVCSLKESDFVLDAAQSVGTIWHHKVAISSKILFFPLHKHLAIQAGLGVLCIKNKNHYPEISKIARISESGTVDIRAYNNALSRCEDNPSVFNVAYFNLMDNEINELENLGFKCITSLNSKTPFVVLQSGFDLDKIPCNKNSIITIKKIGEMMYRFTCYKNGTMNSEPINCNLQLIEYIEGLL